MSKKFIVKTPFGIGVATSDEDLKELLSFVTGGPVSKEEIAEMLLGEDRMTQEEVDACDCENCQHNAEMSAKKIAALREFIALVDHPEPLNFMKEDLNREISNATVTVGEDHPATKHLKEMLKVVEEHNKKVSAPDAKPVETKKKKTRLKTGLRGILAYDIEMIRSITSLDQLKAMRAYLVTGRDALGNDDKAAEVNTLIEEIDARLFDFDGAEDLLEKEDNPGTEGPDESIPTKDSIMAMEDYDAVDQVQISLEAEMNRLSDQKQAIVDEIHAEMKRVEDLHSVAATRKAELLENKAASAHIHIADKVKALQEAITESAPHLLIHEDIAEAMEILKERYRK
ncbi:hypothetical protein C0431_13070 [bacterium]|nr:hypothetical protein [bacterium]